MLTCDRFLLQAWQTLGTTQAENENEQAAIASLQRSDQLPVYLICSALTEVANCSPAAGVWSSAPTTCRPSWRSPPASPTAASCRRPATLCAAGSATTTDTDTWSRAGVRYRVPQPHHAGAPAAPHLQGNETPEQDVSVAARRSPVGLGHRYQNDSECPRRNLEAKMQAAGGAA